MLCRTSAARHADDPLRGPMPRGTRPARDRAGDAGRSGDNPAGR